MQLLETQPDGRHLCLLDDEELALLRGADGGHARRDAFLRDLYALPLDGATANAVARALERQPQLFEDERGQMMTLQTWAGAVQTGHWSAPGVGPGRVRKIVEALGRAAPASPIPKAATNDV